MYSCGNQITTDFLAWYKNLVLEQETENPFCELGLKCRVFQPEGISGFDAPFLWDICVLAGSVLCGDPPSARPGHAPRMGFPPAGGPPCPRIRSSPPRRRRDFPGLFPQSKLRSEEH